MSAKSRSPERIAYSIKRAHEIGRMFPLPQFYEWWTPEEAERIKIAMDADVIAEAAKANAKVDEDS